MVSKSGLALKLLQWFIRGIEFLCAAVVLGIFSYFLAALHNNGFDVPTWTKAVEGISGAGVLYTITGLLLLCCLAGHPITSSIAILLDICFIGAFAYVAYANRAGANSCSGSVNTPFGVGSGDNQISGSTNGFTKLPTYKEACKLETASFAVSIIAIFFFILSILVELALIRNRRKEKSYGPSPANNYTSGSGRKKGFMGRFGKKHDTAATHDDNVLPMHNTPNDVRASYNTDATAVGAEPAHHKYGESGHAKEGVIGHNTHNNNVTHGTHGLANNNVDTTHYPEHGTVGTHDETAHPPGIVQHSAITHPANYRYEDGTY